MSDSIKLKRADVANIYSVLVNMKGNYPSKLKYAIKRNKDLLSKEFESIREESNTKVEKLKEFEEKRMAIIRDHAEKTPDGKLVSDAPNSIKIAEDKREEYKTVVAALVEEYKETLDQRKKEVEDFDKSLLEEVTVEVHKFSNELVPNELTQDEYEILFQLISD